MTADRPRDALGRPLPMGADPALAAEPVPDIVGLTDDEAWSTAVAYIDRGLPFHAHEIFEQRWRTCAGGVRDAWRALAQWGAALTHEARGNAVGAHRLAERTLDGLVHADHVPRAIDVDRVRASCEGLRGG